MKISSTLFLILVGLVAYPDAAPGANNGFSVEEILLQRLEAMEAERDEAEKALLELRARTGPLINEMARERLRLNEEIDNARKQLFQLNSATSTTGEASRRAEQDLSATRERIETLEAQLETDHREFAEALNALRESERTLENALESERTAAERLRERMSERQAQLEVLRNQEQTLRQERDDIQALNESLQNELQSAQRDAALSQAQLNALSSRMELLRGQMAEAYQGRDQAERERDQLAGRVQSLEDQLKTARDEGASREALERMQQEIDLARAENEMLNEALEAERRRPDLTRDLERITRERDLLDAQIKTMQTRVANAEQARQEMELANRDLQSKLAQREAQIEANRRELETLTEEVRHGRRAQARVGELEQTNRALLDHLAKVEGGRRELLDQLDGLREELTEAREIGLRAEEIDEVREILKDLSEENNILREALEAEGMAMETLSQEMHNIQQSHLSELNEPESLLASSMRELNLMRQRVADLQEQGARVSQLEAANRDLAAARDQARRDLRTLARHIQALRRERMNQQNREREFQKEREAFIRRIMELESMNARPNALPNTPPNATP